ncbi:MAG TPA: GNAT family N-acetyltransferase [Candidatus Tectomicrobia bacterium]|nr:GNAT family N-acetyltransferase [Candidatus Tectomicrobia bacterium]
MRLSASLDTAPAGWDDVVRRLDGCVFHSAAWADYQRETRRVRPVFLLGRDDAGEERAAALAFLRSSARPVASLFVRALALASHPAVHAGDGAVAARFLEACERWARARGCQRLRVDSFMSGDSPLALRDLGYREHARVEFLVSLEADTAALWHAIRKDQRERIRRLAREGVTCEPGGQADDVTHLQVARETTQERRRERGQGYELPDDHVYDALYRHLVKRDAGRLFVARRAGEPVAAIFFATFNGRACSIFSGSTDAGYRLGAQSGLYWAAVEAFKAEGYRELNRGGVPAAAADESHPLHGIYEFKARLGTTPTACRSGEKIVSPIRHGLERLARLVRAAGGRG